MWRALGRVGYAVLAFAGLATACGESTRSGPTPTSGAGGAGGAGGASPLGGTVSLAGAGAAGAPPAYSCFTNRAPEAPLQRLSVPDIDRALQDLFGDGPTLAARMAFHEPQFERTLSLPFVTALRDIALERAASAVKDGEVFKLCAGGPVTDINCAENWLRDWGERLYRRPLTDEQLEAYVAQFRAAARDSSEAAAARNALVSMILSPYFVLRIELGQSPNSSELLPEELAARLSHFVTRSTPDDTLRAAAQDGELATPQGMLAQYLRLADTPRGKSARELFVLEWFGLDRPIHRPEISAELEADMTREASQLITDVFDQQGGSLYALLTTTRQFVNRRLTEHYGLAPAAPDDGSFVPVNFEPATNAAGLLTTGAFLTRYPRPSARGLQIQLAVRNYLAPPPPPNIDPRLGPGATPRERISSVVNANPTCVGCHRVFDPIGFALEAFDDLGRETTFDTTGSASLSTGEISLQNPAALGQALTQDGQALMTAVRRSLELALDRRLTGDVSGSEDGTHPAPPPAPIPIREEEPDVEWLRCLQQQAGSQVDLNRVRSAIVTSQAFRQRSRPPRHVVAFDVSVNPLEHARAEASSFGDAFSTSYDNGVVLLYVDSLRELALREGQPPQAGAGGEASGGAGQVEAAGAPSTGGAP